MSATPHALPVEHPGDSESLVSGRCWTESGGLEPIWEFGIKLAFWNILELNWRFGTFRLLSGVLEHFDNLSGVLEFSRRLDLV
jgi:hypothetical protein